MEVGFWKKTWAWLKKYSHLVIAGLGTVMGFVFGISLGRTNPDIKRLRESNRELANQIRQFRDRIAELENLNRASKDECERLREQLDRAEQSIGIVESELNNGSADLGQLAETNRKLAQWIQKYGKELESIQSR